METRRKAKKSRLLPLKRRLRFLLRRFYEALVFNVLFHSLLSPLGPPIRHSRGSGNPERPFPLDPRMRGDDGWEIFMVSSLPPWKWGVGVAREC